eukprot:jgi/Ulvmu1/1449/UM011_0179.1
MRAAVNVHKARVVVPVHSLRMACRAHNIEFQMLDGRKQSVEVEDGENLLDAMIEAGLDPTYDCKMGVCMTCPARLTSGHVEQAAAMLSDDVREKGYALMCVAEPTTDCTVQEITEAEILDQQLCA